jgi:uncharacterized membrane protein (UPF0127 family)
MGTNTKWKRANIKQLIFVLVLIAVVVVGVQVYYQQTAEGALLKCQFQNTAGASSAVFKLEIASTPGERSKGLMYRKSLAENHGMIFIYPEMQTADFWMKDTYIPLDMIFIDNNFKVVGILKDVPVNNEKKRSVGAQSQYVVELSAGASKKNGIAAGAVLRCEGALPRGV